MVADNNYHEVFFSYTHDSVEHKENVLELCVRLRKEGVDAYIDRFVDTPSEGWPQWMQGQIEHSSYVLVICSETYKRRMENAEQPGVGLGAKWEGTIITQSLYQSESKNRKFIPVVLQPEGVQHIPAVLSGATYYDVSTESGYEKLYRYITAQPEITIPPLGQRRSMPPIMPDATTSAAHSQPKQAIVEANPRELSQVVAEIESVTDLVKLPDSNPIILISCLSTQANVGLSVKQVASPLLSKQLVHDLVLGTNAYFDLGKGTDVDAGEDRLLLQQHSERGSVCGTFAYAGRSGLLSLGYEFADRKESAIDMKDFLLLDEERVRDGLTQMVGCIADLYPKLYGYSGQLYVKSAVVNMGNRSFGKPSNNGRTGWPMHMDTNKTAIWVPAEVEPFDFPLNTEVQSEWVEMIVQLFYYRFKAEGRLLK